MNGTAAGDAAAGVILVLNCGSSSIKFALFDAAADPPPRRPLWNGKVQGIGGPAPDFGAAGVAPLPVTLDAEHPNAAALQLILDRVTRWLRGRPIVAVAHRVVHGGSRHFAPVRVTAALIDELRSYIPLAPLHQPFPLKAMAMLQKQHPDVAQVACFDTAFHRDMPDVEQTLPLPREWLGQGLRRYGFHGLSYEYMARVLPERHGSLADGRVIVAHLGSGASLCAMRGRHSVATTMGFSALEGLMMGTRCGSLDPGVLLYLMESRQLTPATLGHLLYQQSGLLGASGLSSEPRVVVQHEDDPGEAGARARLALALYVRRIVREIGALTAILGGLDLLVFTAGVGEHNAFIRERTCRDLAFLGIVLDAAANAANGALISTPESPVRVAVEPTNEEWVMALHARSMCTQGDAHTSRNAHRPPSGLT